MIIWRITLYRKHKKDKHLFQKKKKKKKNVVGANGDWRLGDQKRTVVLDDCEI